MPLYCPVCEGPHQNSRVPDAYALRNAAMADALKAWPGRATSPAGRTVHAVADGRTRCGYGTTGQWHTVPSDSLVECDQCLRVEAPTRIRASQTNTTYRARQPAEYRRWRAAQTTTTVVAALTGDPVEAARALRRLGADNPGVEATITAIFGTPDERTGAEDERLRQEALQAFSVTLVLPPVLVDDQAPRLTRREEAELIREQYAEQKRDDTVADLTEQWLPTIRRAVAPEET